ncbi:ABC transporter ATP-binding protein [Notoacmeibacter sp. MSK16QG-6]|uniref:ABC transporter ATP-binding protein n=1 Tax=Notoacmeibacter sp. MSK16QG-6 TaxID=2957982 RepID=UPI0020A01DF6|nr:ABC transporter ATP-binding protein [Notoacmeibacter sp. MSK16QG-6]MCP1199885.1 ABC transporter ATP-binding protein/permease [Notoacmeibacter sp. MSK16QG-6]
MIHSLFRRFERFADPFPDIAIERPPTGLFPFIWHHTKPVWHLVALGGILTALISVAQIVIFSFMGDVVDWLAGRPPDEFFTEEFWTLLGMGALILIAMPILGILHDLLLFQTLAGNFPMIIRWQGHRYLLRQSVSFFADEFAGRVSTKLMQGALGIREVVMKTVDVFAYVAIYFAGAVILMATFDPVLMIPFMVWIVLYFAILGYFLPRLRKTSEVQANARSEMTGRVVDSYTNIATIKLFAHAGREERYARDAMDRFLHTVFPQMRLVTLLNTSLGLANALLLFAIGALGLWSWSLGAASVGAVAVGLGLVMRLEGMSHWVMWELAGLFENLGMAEDAASMLAKPQTVTDRPDARSLVVKDGAVHFDNVSFHYGKGEGVIGHLDLSIRPGEKIGLVGRSGAGKSTLVNLLLRFHDVEDGRITIDGTDIASVSQDSLRAHIGVVTQDTALLHRSVRDNIQYSRPDAGMHEIERAAREAKAIDFIGDLSDPTGRVGFDAHVGERGVKLSGGQRQRIAIARVMLKDAPILVLDEATSALDSEVEAAIQDSLDQLMKGKTVIAIAHRLSTISQMDRLVVMDRGAIVEEGTHDDLIAQNGLYARLWARQSGGFLRVDEPVDGQEVAAQ